MRLNGVALQSCQNLCKFGKIYATCVFACFKPNTSLAACLLKENQIAEIKVHMEQLKNI